ncbi:DinB family protein [Nocardioides dongxiaopingii]|uniref:mycothiol transferase n=1 Tax=Nocardioides sp. S-1144 TaxID=2582905 RepID=UPI00110D93F7|nr:DinB family protein [Nocardioides sp. S-1144]QCW52250.1 DinB family protein [Nocardioides sp. S-1144]
MTPAEVIVEGLERVRESGLAVLDGLTPEQLGHRPTPDANPIGWLVWHLARVQDDHVADVAGAEQVYPAFAGRFALPYDEDAIGYGQSSAEVGAGTWDAALLAEYLVAVHERSVAHVATLAPADLDRVVDDRWDPPVTLGVRLVSVVNDNTQHVGQAAYVRGMLGL